MKSKHTLSLIGVFILFFLLFNIPFIGLPSSFLSGYPTVMIYIGVCWILLVVVMRLISLKQDK